jgi:hypothetical protein
MKSINTPGFCEREQSGTEHPKKKEYLKLQRAGKLSAYASTEC